MISTAKISMLKLVPKLKSNKLLKFLLLDMKANSIMLMRLDTTEIAQNKLKCRIFCVVPERIDYTL